MGYDNSINFVLMTQYQAFHKWQMKYVLKVTCMAVPVNRRKDNPNAYNLWE